MGKKKKKVRTSTQEVYKIHTWVLTAKSKDIKKILETKARRETRM